MTYQEKFELIGRDCDLIDAEIERLQAELERKKERRAQADAFLKTFIGDAVVEPVADEPVIAPVPVVDDRPEIISEPVKDEPVIVAPTVVADEPVIVPPASTDSDLGAMLAAIQRAGVKVGNDFKPVVVADDAEPVATTRWTNGEVFRVYSADRIRGGETIIAHKGDMVSKFGEEVTVRPGSLLHWLLFESFCWRDANKLDESEMILCSVMAEQKGEWMSVSEIHKRAVELGFRFSRASAYNWLADYHGSLLNRFADLIEEERDGKKRMFRLTADIDLSVKNWE